MSTPAPAAVGSKRRVWPLWVGVAVLLAVPPVMQALPPRIAWSKYVPQAGDVVFQSLPHGEVVAAIEGSTGSPWSHCGIVAEEEGRWYVYEAIGEVRRTPLGEYYRRGRDGRFSVCRLKGEYRDRIPAMLDAARERLGVPYDLRYRMEDDEIYCSELVFKAFRAATGEELGKTVALGELKWQPYQQIIEQLEGGPAPLDRVMITPRDLREASQLEIVAGSE